MLKLDEIYLKQALPEVAVEVFDQLPSTNLYAKQCIAKQHYQNIPRLIVANEQTAGYGRRNRQFFSPADVGIYMSLVFPLRPNQLAHPGTLTLNIAVAVQSVVKQVLGVDLTIKWVNDLYRKQRKVVGILVEVPQPPVNQQLGTVVIGIGINLNQTTIPENLQKKIGAISDEVVKREQVIVALQKACAKVINQPFKDLRAQYLAHSLLLNRTVSLHTGHQDIVGQVIDIDEQGRLVLKQDNQIHAFSSGEVVKVNFHDGEKNET